MMRRVEATQRLRAVEASVSSDAVISALDDPSPEVARAAIRRLVALEGDGAAPALRARVLDVELGVVADFAKALAQIGDGRVLEMAIGGLDDQRPTRRLAAIRAIGVLADDPAGVGPLRAALDDDVAGVRAAALEVLGRMARPGASVGADCARLLSDPVAYVRTVAVRTVARLVSHPGPTLSAAAEDQDRLVRLAVGQFAASLPERAARALLEDPDVRVREAAARAAGVREVDALAALLRDDRAPDVRRAAAHSLGAMHEQQVADLVLPGLEDRHALVRVAALGALERLLTREGAVRRLCDELSGERASRRRACLYALARLDAREAARELTRLVTDPDPEVRLALIHTAALLDEPERIIRYLSRDTDQAVRNAAEMWRLRASRAES